MTDTMTMDPDLLAEMKAAGLIDDSVMASVNHANDPTPATPEMTHEELEQHIESEENREAMYAEQESKTDMIEESEVIDTRTKTKKPRKNAAAPKPPKEKKAPKEKVVKEKTVKEPKPPKEKKPKAEKPPAAPRKSRVAASGSIVDHVKKIVGDDHIQITGSEKCSVETIMNDLPVKIQEKVVNLFDHVFAGKRLSVFSQAGFKELNAEGKISGKRLVEIYQSGDDPYSIGTARSQSQQIASMFRRLNITNDAGEINHDSALLRAPLLAGL